MSTATFRTGRQRTAQWQTGLDGTLHYVWQTTLPPPGGTAIPFADCDFSAVLPLGGPGVQASVIGAAGANFAPGAVGEMGGTAIYAQYYLRLLTGLGGGTAGTATATLPYPPPAVTWSVNPVGSAVINLPVEERVDITFGAYDGYQAPAVTSLRFFEYARAGGTLTVQATWGSVSLSVSDTIGTAGFELSDYGFDLSAHDTSTNTTGWMHLDGPAFGTAGLTAPYTAGTIGGTITANGHVRADTAANGSITYAAQITADLWAARLYALTGVTQRMGAAYAGTVQYAIDRAAAQHGSLITSTGGTVSDSNSQQRYTVSGSIPGGTVPGTALNEQTPFKIIAGTASLATAGEDVRDTRVWTRWFPAYTVETLSQAIFFTVDAGDSLTPATQPYAGAWVNVANGSLSIVGGNVQIAVSGGPGTVERNFGTAQKAGFGGYRYLKFTGSADADGRTIDSITLDGKTWTRDYQGSALVFNAAAGTLWLDLCAPTNASGTIDATDSRYPLPTQDGEYWGVTGVGTMRLNGLAQGGTYSIDLIQVAMHPTAGTCRWTALSPFNVWYLEQTATVAEVTTQTYAQPAFCGDTDGRRSWELPSIKRFVSSVAGTTYGEPTITQMLGEGVGSGNPALEPNPLFGGWGPTPPSPTDPASPTGTISAWLNANRPSVWLCGPLYVSSAWAQTIDLNTKSGAAARAQLIATETIDWYPEAGDCGQLDGTAYGGAMQVRSAYLMRGEGWGLVIGGANLPGTGIAVTATDTTDSSSAGAGTSDSQGIYYTGLPYGRGNHNIQVSASGVTYDRTWDNRFRHRVVLPPGSDWISLDISDAMRHYRAYTRGGALIVGGADNFGAWLDTNTGASGSHPCVRVDRRSREQAVYLDYEAGGAVLTARTKDEGRGIAIVGTVTAQGRFPALVCTRNGLRYHYWLAGTAAASGTAILGQIEDAQGTVVYGPFAAVSGTIDASPLAADEYLQGAGVWKMRLLYRQGSALVDMSSIDGINFS